MAGPVQGGARRETPVLGAWTDRWNRRLLHAAVLRAERGCRESRSLPKFGLRCTIPPKPARGRPRGADQRLCEDDRHHRSIQPLVPSSVSRQQHCHRPLGVRLQEERVLLHPSLALPRHRRCAAKGQEVVSMSTWSRNPSLQGAPPDVHILPHISYRECLLWAKSLSTWMNKQKRPRARPPNPTAFPSANGSPGGSKRTHAPSGRLVCESWLAPGPIYRRLSKFVAT